MKKHFIYYLIFSVILFPAIMSCSDSDGDDNDNPGGGDSNNGTSTLSLNPTTLEFAPKDDGKTFKITTNGDWVITMDASVDWVKLSALKGNGNADVTVTPDENETFSVRSAVLTVKVSTISRKLTVRQEAAPTDPDDPFSTDYLLLKNIPNSAGEQIVAYKMFSTGDAATYDAYTWRLKGSNDGEEWTIVDERAEQSFFARYQEQFYIIETPGEFTQYRLEAIAQYAKTTPRLGEVVLYSQNPVAAWESFGYPVVEYIAESAVAESTGGKQFRSVVQDPVEFMKYHTQKVAEILYYLPGDQMPAVSKVNYKLESWTGSSVADKSGAPPTIQIRFNAKYIGEFSGGKTVQAIVHEMRGVLYHELTHGYQFEPKNCGSYDGSSVYWTFIEGLADAVRADAGLFDNQVQNRKDSSKDSKKWMAGYRTTGYFIQWMKTKDKDAIRKFNRTAKDLETWTWDAAVKAVFPTYTGVEQLWNEYYKEINK